MEKHFSPPAEAITLFGTARVAQQTSRQGQDMNAKWAAVVGMMLLATAAQAAPPKGYRPKVFITGPTRLDWTFAVANQSLAQPPADWLPKYDSIAQNYEMFVPSRRGTAKKPLPVIVFISPGNEPMGWKHFEGLCKDNDILFAGPRGAGNDCPPKLRVRIVLDVLDDLRRNHYTDPDRTYVAGFSGGGRIACAIAFALPELFGGVMSICAGGDLREESWLRQRVIDRLSVALLTGERDFNRGEVERLRGPYLKEVGVRTRVWTQPALLHNVPAEKYLGEAFRWLEEAAAARQEAAKKNPGLHLPGNTAPGREEMAKALFAEGKKRLSKRETVYSGLMQLQGCMKRWPDLPTAVEAKLILLEYEVKKDQPWEADDIAEQRRFLNARARALDAYASGDLPKEYVKMRPDMARQAIELWQKVLADAPDSPAGRQAAQRIPALEKLAGAPGK
jgi:pimeloyl-ACP methyl ester carboxylesterase